MIQDYKNTFGKESANEIENLKKKLTELINKRTSLNNSYLANVDSVRIAKDEIHRMVYTNHMNYFQKAIADFDQLYQIEIQLLPSKIAMIEHELANGIERITLVTQNRKFALFRINEFRKNNTFLFLIALLVVASLFLLPYVIRFKMIFTNSTLDKALEQKIISKIKRDFRNFEDELNVYHKKYEVVFSTPKIIFEDESLVKKTHDNGEIVAVKNQLNKFLNNEV
jgi:hypothetical protein